MVGDQRTGFRAYGYVEGAPDVAVGRSGSKGDRCAGDRAHDDGECHQPNDQHRTIEPEPSHRLLEALAIAQDIQHTGTPQHDRSRKKNGEYRQSQQDSPPRRLGKAF